MKKIIITLVLSVIVAFATGCGSTQKEVSVKAPPADILAKIVIKPSEPVLQPDKTVILTAFGYTKDDKEIDLNPAWSMDEAGKKIGTLSTNQGKIVMFSAKRIGNAYIYAASGDIKAKVKVQVLRIANPK